MMPPKVKISGIYSIHSKCKPDRVYIGSSFDILKRWNLHKSKLKKNIHHTPKLQNHYNKYGLDDLSFIIIEETSGTAIEYLLTREQYYIDNMKPWFNSRLKAENNAGFKMKKASCDRISRGNKNKPKSPEHCAALSKAWEKRKLIPISEETRAKFSKAATGRPCWAKGLTKETDNRIKASAEKKTGKNRPKEECLKISNTMKTLKKTPEHIENARKGRWGK